MEQKTLEYVVPRKIRLGYEFAPGWGWQQVVVPAVGLAVGMLLFFVLRVISSNLLMRVIVLVLPAGIGFLASRPQTDGTTALEMILSWREWSKKQKLYNYDFGRDDV